MSERQGTKRYQAVIASPFPARPYLGLSLKDGRLNSIDFLGPDCEPFISGEEGVGHAVSSLQRYISLDSCDTQLSLQPEGTPFQQRVWRQLRQIPYGQVMRYGELAKALRSSARAVAGACRANPIPILIPCHRVIAASGLGGYMGATGGDELAIKQWLLQHEGYV